MDTDAFNTLELELRQIPRVLGVGIEEVDHAVMVHLLTSAPGPQTMLLRSASEVVRNHTSGQVVLTMSVSPSRREPVQARDIDTIRLKGVRRSPGVGADEEADEISVELIYNNQVVVGRSTGRGPRAAAVATLAALANLDLEAPFVLRAALRLVDWLPDRQVVVTALTSLVGGSDRVGVGQGADVDDAACLAVLQALAAVDGNDVAPALAPVSQLYD